MRILQLCKKFPYPAKDGESLAVMHLSKSLKEVACEIGLLSMNTSRHRFEENSFPEQSNHYSFIELVDVDNNIYIKDAILNIFSKESFHISRFISEAFSNKLIEILSGKEFDFVQLETLVLAAYIPIIRKYSNAKILMRSHNVEFEIWERITQNTGFFPKKWYLSLLAKRLKGFEIKQMNQYDLFAAISEKDLNRYKNLGLKKPAIYIPIGIGKKDYIPNYKVFENNISISFIGSLDWRPNLEGLNWFINHIWDKISEAHPEIEFHIAGRNTPKEILDLKKKNIFVHGEVDDAKSFINDHPIMVVPLKSGSGMRVKILEGMALGRVVITSTLGLEGISAKEKKEVLIADGIEEYIQAIDYCKKNKSQILEIGKNAENFILEQFDEINIALKLKNKMEEISQKTKAE